MILFMSGSLENENALDCLAHWIAPHCGFVGGCGSLHFPRA